MPLFSSLLSRGLNTFASRSINLLEHTCVISPSSDSHHPATPARASEPSIRRRFALVALLFLPFLPCLAQSSGVLSSSDVEAAYLYNFGKFTEWPAPADASTAPFSICVLGKDDFGSALDSVIQNDTIHGHPVVTRRLPSLAVAYFCQILFLGASEQARLDKDLEALKDKPILTVSSIPGFLERGGMIQFLVADSRIRFAVNLAPATHAHLTLSSELLKVAVYVESKPSREGE